MDYTYFLFALFVCAMLALLVFLNDRLKRSRMNENNQVSEKEQRLFKLYQNLEDMIDGFEEYVEDVKAEIARERQEAEDLAKTVQPPALGISPTPISEVAIPREYRVAPGPAPADVPSLAVLPYKTVAKMTGAYEEPAQDDGKRAKKQEKKDAAAQAKAAPVEPDKLLPIEKKETKPPKEAGTDAEAASAKKRPVKSTNHVNTKIKKVEEVRKLKKQGLNEDEIAKKLSLSHGEVALIIGLPSSQY